MIQEKSYGKINVVIIFYEIAALLYNTSILRIMGYGFILLGTGYLLYLWCTSKKIIKNKSLLISIMILVAIYFISFVRNITLISIRNICSLFMTLVVLLGFSNVTITDINEKYQRYIVGIQLCIIFLPMFLGIGYSSVDGGYKSIYTTTTFLGLFSSMSIELSIFFFSLYKKKIWIAYGLLWSYLVLKSKVRTAMIGILLSFVLILMLIQFKNTIYKNNILMLAKWGIYLMLVFVVIIYPNFDMFWFYPMIENFVYNVTGKMFFTGRNTIWKYALESIGTKPLFGYGLDYSESFYDVYGFSVHNSYLNILLQNGIIGLVTIFLLINSSINGIKYKYDFNKSIIFIFTMTNLLMCASEVMLLQGQIILQIIIWSLIGIGNNMIDLGKSDSGQ